jgi:hypothetical protein
VPLYPENTGVVIQNIFLEVTADDSTTSAYVAGPPVSGYVTLLTTPIITQEGFLRVVWTASVSNDVATCLCYFRIMLDGVMQKGMSVRVNAVGTAHAVVVSSYTAITAGTHTVTVDWCTTSGGAVRITAATYPASNVHHGSLLVQEIQA